MILRPPAPPRRRWPAGLALAALAAAALPWAPALADDPPPPVPPVTEPVRPAEAGPPADPPPTPAAELPRTAARPLPTPASEPPRTAAPLPITPPAARNAAVTGDELDRLKEEVELLAVQSQARRAAVRIAKNALVRAEEKVSHTEGMVKKGFSQAEDLRRARLDVEDARAQLEMREAELQEYELRIAQAKRRLDRASTPRQPTVTSGTIRVNPVPRSAPPRAEPVSPPTPAGAATSESRPMVRDRLKQLDAEVAQLNAERNDLAARVRHIEAQMKELRDADARLNDRAKQLMDLRDKLLKGVKDDPPSRP